MATQTETAQHVGVLIDGLASEDVNTRMKSRKKLIRRGDADTIRELILMLMNPKPHARWEAAKALHAIGDPVAAAALMDALDDENPDVRWVAGEGLIALGEVGVRSVLRGLMKRAGSPAYSKSAYHVLHKMRSLAPELEPVVKALETSEPGVTAPVPAYEALTALTARESAP